MDLCSLGNLISGQPGFPKRQELVIISSQNSLNSLKSMLMSVVIVQLSLLYYQKRDNILTEISGLLKAIMKSLFPKHKNK